MSTRGRGCPAEFDLAYCIVVAALGTDRSSGYPSSVAFDEDRAKPVAQKIANGPEMRHRLLPAVDDPAVADALYRTYEMPSASPRRATGLAGGPCHPVWTRSSPNIAN